MSDNWSTIVDELRGNAQRMHEAREVGLQLCRKLIQSSAKCIRHVHRREFEDAERMLAAAKAIAQEARTALAPFPELYQAGYLQDAEKEMVEASAVLAIVLERPFESAAGLQTQTMAYLNGMGEAASEVRRFALDEMRRGDLAKAEAILRSMETIYDDLITFDYADSMTSGLRRTCDALRAVIERTRSDLTATSSQQALVSQLRATQEAFTRKAD